MRKSIKRTKVSKKELVKKVQEIADINADTKTTLKNIQDTFPKHRNESLVVSWRPEDKVVPYAPEKKKEKTNIDLEVAKYRMNETYEVRRVESFPSPEFQMWDKQHPFGTYYKLKDAPIETPGAVISVDELPYKQEVSFWRKIQNWFRSKFE